MPYYASFTKWVVVTGNAELADEKASETSFVMPGEAVTVRAEYRINASPHTHSIVTDPAVAATCTATGLTEGKHCSGCNAVIVKQELTPMLAHSYADGKCSVCGAADPNYTAPLPFKDVSKDSPYADAIGWAYENKITSGRTSDTFGVKEGCTRAEIVAFLYRAVGSPEVSADVKNPFTDVSESSAHYKAIMWAVENGITKGTTDTTFSPTDTCTRGHIVTFLYRYKGSPAIEAENPFTDVKPGSFCYDAVMWAVAYNITYGMTDTTFAPSDTCTRGQAVTFIWRLMK